MKVHKLNADPKLQHHYFIAVAIKQMSSDSPGEMFLKYRPFYLNHKQIKKFLEVSLLTQDKLFRTSQDEALKMHGLSEIAKSFYLFKLAAKVNQCTLHHFSSESEINEEWFKTYIKSANKHRRTREQLFSAKIHY
ncbi:MAG: hypothetical protein ACFFG0_00030 [Candidatus Thorarchaeota archaeon]